VPSVDPYECTLGFSTSDARRSGFHAIEISTEETLWDDTRDSTSEIFSYQGTAPEVEISIGR
jgi:hypothetical protein